MLWPRLQKTGETDSFLAQKRISAVENLLSTLSESAALDKNELEPKHRFIAMQSELTHDRNRQLATLLGKGFASSSPLRAFSSDAIEYYFQNPRPSLLEKIKLTRDFSDAGPLIQKFSQERVGAQVIPHQKPVVMIAVSHAAIIKRVVDQQSAGERSFARALSPIPRSKGIATHA
jgi:hypothetical protein